MKKKSIFEHKWIKSVSNYTLDYLVIVYLVSKWLNPNWNTRGYELQA